MLFQTRRNTVTCLILAEFAGIQDADADADNGILFVVLLNIHSYFVLVTDCNNITFVLKNNNPV